MTDPLGGAADFGAFDVIVVGAGSAGCVIANRLSADPARRVLLVEAGKGDNHPWVHIPVGYLFAIGNPRLDWGFRTEPVPGLGGRSLLYPRGKVLGGCSSINGMIYMRGQAADYDGWRALGNPGWGWDEVLPLFRRSEHHFGKADAAHGSEGELRVEQQRLRWPILDEVARAAVEMGIPATADFNAGDNEGVGYFPVNQRRGIRWNARKAFLDPARRRPNLVVLTECHVRRLILEGRRATGILFTRGGSAFRASARQEVILAAGAIGSPQLLELSGIGDPAHLAGIGIEPVHALPGVGENLQDHLQLRTIFAVTGARTLNDRAATPWGKAGIALQYALTQSGPMAMAPSQLGIFTRSGPEHNRANIEYHVQPLSLDAFGQPLHRTPALTVSVCNLRPTSRGATHATAPDAVAAPAIQPNYLSTEADRTVAAESIRHARRLMATRTMARYRPTEVKPGPGDESDAALAKLAGEIGTTIFHPVGTARMGSDDAAVVDPELRVRGIGGLRVADCSIMPTIVSGNTHAAAVMIGEKAAELVIAAGRG
ncbi:GMC family oxidoreductase N-terminal domain-containing protein [Kaistia geumhonensis]|uniref:Choline dehydrogenase n=1 Tax=Kaistia geumhonensis TaxID=410839 RepID=A0ABU0M534_9HYPH|nr:GMC family oxidoreductase N-terminal domain-containing protein [Kaistia geumhonensis]MCX5478716.1 GMC family oxidoreductase N-terminal domain-containing protein [Kaistia geumhonensis]MDQ0516066.1 choline dehydrogenase [Kaistia geumhonensis]